MTILAGSFMSMNKINCVHNFSAIKKHFSFEWQQQHQQQKNTFAHNVCNISIVL